VGGCIYGNFKAEFSGKGEGKRAETHLRGKKVGKKKGGAVGKKEGLKEILKGEGFRGRRWKQIEGLPLGEKGRPRGEK